MLVIRRLGSRICPRVYAWEFTVEEVKFPADSRFLREHRLSQKQSDCGCGSISELIGVIRV